MSMSYHRLPNYIHTYCKRNGLSAQDAGFLIGQGSGASMSRYKYFRRVPSLQNSLRLIALFREQAEELFAGEYEKAEEFVAERKQLLRRQLSQSQQIDRWTMRKLEFLGRNQA